jgi:predicted ATPase
MEIIGKSIREGWLAMRHDEDGDRLLRAALRVVDGRSNDWSALAEESPAHAPILDKLRELEAVAELFRLPSSNLDALQELAAPGERVLFRWGHLRALERIGRGGYGDVYRAFDDTLQREVALKLLHSESPATNTDLLAEARRLARIRHPNVLTVLGADMHDARVGIWFDLLRGPTLEDRLQGTAVQPDEAISILLDVCDALEAVHAAGLVYGDLKANNVVLDEQGHAVLCDFGSSRPTHDSANPGFHSGSPLALPPEAFQGSTPGIAGDVYATGVLFFRLLTRVHPIDASSLDELIAQHEQQKRHALRDLRPDLPAEWHAFSERLLAWKPEERYDSIDAVRAEAETCLERWTLLRRMTSPSVDGRVAAHPTNPLPRTETAFVGRQSDLEKLARALHAHSQVSLIGPAGCGKTRLAIEAASREHNAFPGGLHFVDLATVTDPARIPDTIAESLQIDRPRDGALEDALREHFRSAAALVLLDNCEHLRDAVRRFLEQTHSHESRTHLLLTSREAVRTDSEQVLIVDPLSCPPSAQRDPRQVLGFEAVELFVERVQRVVPSFRLDGDNVEAVVSICRRLDGLPLALELAAARSSVLSVQEIEARLSDRFGLLTGGAILPRHHTLRALIDWSFDHLEPEERTLLRRLSVFRGGASVAAIESIARDGGAEAIGQRDPDPGPRAFHGTREQADVDRVEWGGNSGAVIDLLSSLAEKFLIVRTATPGSPARIGMLETIRHYAGETLDASGETALIRDRHAAYFAQWAAALRPLFLSGKQAEAVKKVAAELPNLATALDHLRAADRHEDALELANSLAMFWWIRGAWKEAGDTFSDLLLRLGPGESIERSVLHVAPRDQEDPPTVSSEREDQPGLSRAAIRARIWSGHFAMHRGDFAEAETQLLRAHDQAVECADEELIAKALASRGHLAFARTDLLEAERLLETALQWERANGDPRAAALLLTSLTNTAEMKSDLKTARARCEESLTLLERLEDPSSLAYALHRLAGLTLRDGEVSRARVSSERALRLADQVGNRWTAAASRALLGDIAISRELWAEADEHLKASLAIFRELRDSGTLLRVLYRLARVALGVGDFAAARERLDDALAIERTIDSPRDLLCLLQGYRDLALAAHRFEHAARLQGAVAGFAERGRIELWPDEAQSMKAATVTLQALLEPTELDRRVAEGRSLERTALYPLCSAE